MISKGVVAFQVSSQGVYIRSICLKTPRFYLYISFSSLQSLWFWYLSSFSSLSLFKPKQNGPPPQPQIRIAVRLARFYLSSLLALKYYTYRINLTTLRNIIIDSRTRLRTQLPLHIRTKRVQNPRSNPHALHEPSPLYKPSTLRHVPGKHNARLPRQEQRLARSRTGCDINRQEQKRHRPRNGEIALGTI